MMIYNFFTDLLVRVGRTEQNAIRHDDSSTAWGLNEVADTDNWVVNQSATRSAGQTKVN